MKVTQKVLDGNTNEPLSYASVVIVGLDGEQVGSGFVAGDDGTIEVDSSELDKKDRLIQVSAAGYNSNIFYPEEWNMPFKIYENSKTTDLEGVTVKGVKPKIPATAKKNNYALPITLGALAAISLTIWITKTV